MIKQKTFRKNLEERNLGEYLDLCDQSDTLLLADVFWRFWAAVFHFSIASCLQNEKIQSEQSPNVDVLFIVESRINHKANNKYIRNCDEGKDPLYLIFFDVKKIYGWKMSSKLSGGGSEWVQNISQFNEDFI